MIYDLTAGGHPGYAGDYEQLLGPFSMIDYEKIADQIEPASAGVPAGPDNQPTDQPSPLRVSDPRFQGLASEKGYKQTPNRISKTNYTHEAMIDVIIAEPTISQNELAARFDRTVPWISVIMGSDAFQAALAKRRAELTDPFLVATIEERFRGLATQSLQVLSEKLQTTQSADLALKSLEISAKALGFGARQAGPANVQNNFVVQLPVKAADSSSWLRQIGQSSSQEVPQ